MANQTFDPGDLVRLKSGGPKMTVEQLSDDKATCSFFDGSERVQEVFVRDALERVE